MKRHIKADTNNLYSESRVARFLRENFSEVMRWRLQNLFNGVREEAYKRGYRQAISDYKNNPLQNG